MQRDLWFKIISPYVAHEDSQIPYMLERVQAGFPSPADDYVEKVISLTELVNIDPSTSFLVEAEGYSMVNTGIMPGDVLHVRRDLEARDGDIVIGIIDGEPFVKKLRNKGNKIIFKAANDDYPDIVPEEFQDVQVWGVVVDMLRNYRKV